MKPMVTLAMIVKDEADSLERALASVADLVDEIVVVDTGSTDHTREVARRFGARVIDFPWTQSFAEARNESLRQARGTWAFWLDADEWVDPEARRQLAALFASLSDTPGETVYLMHQASPFVNREPDSFAITHPRLFPIVEEVRWQYRVHEQILEAWRVRGAAIIPTEIVIRHSGYHDPDQTLRKQARNARLMELDLLDRPDDPWACFQLGRSYREARFPEAEALFRRAMASDAATSLMIRQIYPILVRGYREQGQVERARQTVAEGLGRYPADSILLFESGCFALEAGDLEAARQTFETLRNDPPDPEESLIGSYASLRGWRARNHLALVLVRQGRMDQAEEQWQAALADQPDADPIRIGLGELYLAQARWEDFDRLVPPIPAFEPDAPFAVLMALLRAQGDLARRQFEPARNLLEPMVARDPSAINPRLLLGWCHLMEGQDLASAEQALREVLRIAPGHPEALRGLDALAESGFRAS